MLLLFIIFMYAVDIFITLESLIFTQHKHNYSETNQISKVWTPRPQYQKHSRPLISGSHGFRDDPSCILNLWTLRAWLLMVHWGAAKPSSFFHFVGLVTPASFFTSLSLCVLISKMGLMIPTWGLNDTNVHVKCFSCDLAFW